MTAILTLADGTVFKGHSIGAAGIVIGEVVFNTAMTGYQEVLTDPSYAGQIINFTYPHIGNTGINLADNQSTKIWASGIIIREDSPIANNWRTVQSFSSWLQEHGIVGIAGVNTRQLTKHIRDGGSQIGCIVVAPMQISLQKKEDLIRNYYSFFDKSEEKYPLCSKGGSLGAAERGIYNGIAKVSTPKNLIVIDFGVKNGIIDNLAKHGCNVTVVSANTTAKEMLALQPDGIVLSNGPGDPRLLSTAIANIKQLIETDVPILGICLGLQLLALACNAEIFKMKFGHHGVNHPVQEISTKKIYITSQNHNYAVLNESLPEELIITHRSLFDQTVQGLQHKTKPIYGYQWHPEAGPGPSDSCDIFKCFIQVVNNKRSYA